jgi:hypothetical protein
MERAPEGTLSSVLARNMGKPTNLTSTFIIIIYFCINSTKNVDNSK